MISNKQVEHVLNAGRCVVSRNEKPLPNVWNPIIGNRRGEERTWKRCRWEWPVLEESNTYVQETTWDALKSVEERTFNSWKRPLNYMKTTFLANRNVEFVKECYKRLYILHYETRLWGLHDVLCLVCTDLFWQNWNGFETFCAQYKPDAYSTNRPHEVVWDDLHLNWL